MDERSPYAPPASNPQIVEEHKGAAWKAVLLGVVVDIGGSMALNFITGVIAYVVMTRQGADQDQINKLFTDTSSPPIISLVIAGCLLSVLGGFVCARISKHNELKLAGVMAIISTLFMVIVISPPRYDAFYVFAYAASIASIFFGSWLGMKRNQRRRLHANQG